VAFRLFALVCALVIGEFSAQAQTSRTDAGAGCSCVSNEATKIVFRKANLSASTSDPGSRIQLGRWTDPAREIADPLNQIIEIGGNDHVGTGSLLDHCRVLTALHVLIGIKSNGRRTTLNPDESLIGEAFQFETNPLEHYENQKATGHFVVIGHGDLRGLGAAADAADDWAIGFDEDCLSQRLNLGYFRLATGQTLGLMKGKDFLTAGHSRLNAAAAADGEYALYIDSRCGVTDKNFVDDSYVISTCSLSPGGSGQPLLQPQTTNGKIVFEANGRPRLMVYGIFQTLDLRFLDPSVPNVNIASGVAPLTDSLLADIESCLQGQPDVTHNCSGKTSAFAEARPQ
jgi:hypothetical protein